MRVCVCARASGEMGLRASRPIQSLPFINHVVNILLENLAAAEKNIIGYADFILPPYRHTYTQTPSLEDPQHKCSAVVDSGAITIDDYSFRTLYQNQCSLL